MILLDMVELACTSKACAPPPVGTGGSKPSGDRPAGAGEADSGRSAYDKSEESFPRTLPSERARYAEIETYEPLTALADYAISGYRKMNSGLRNGADPSDPMTGVPTMDKAFDLYSVRLTSPITVYRGINLPKGDDRARVMAQMQPGNVIEEKAFLSTAHDSVGTAAFLKTVSGEGEREPIRVVIEVPKGERVLAGDSYEQELILDRGRRMRVTKVDQGKSDPHGIPTVHMEVVQ